MVKIPLSLWLCALWFSLPGIFGKQKKRKVFLHSYLLPNKAIHPVSKRLTMAARLLTPLSLALIILQSSGEVAELADAQDLGFCAARRRGSSPLFPTHLLEKLTQIKRNKH
jgi:hypothetical protein